MIPRYVYGKAFRVRLPDRSEWKSGFHPDRKRGLIWYTDGSKALKLGCIVMAQRRNFSNTTQSASDSCSITSTSASLSFTIIADLILPVSDVHILYD
jgi:hypothetical protein